MTGLVDKANLYLDLVKSQQGEAGFLHTEACDSLLFTALAVCGGLKADLWAAKGVKGWHRRPLALPECCPDSSKSSISRDMLLGVLLAAFATRDLAMAESVVAQMRRGIMGKYVGIVGLSRVIPTPGLYATARLLVDHLKGSKPSLWRLVPAVDGKVRGGYIDHLSGLHLALRCLLQGHTTARDKKYTKKLFDSNPINPLFVTLHKDTGFALSYLTFDMFWPNYRLPTSRDRLAPWVPERDASEYVPGYGPVHIHTGMDFNFLLWLTLAWANIKHT